MRWRPLRWLLGLPFLALLGAIAVYGQLPHIQDDLRNRAGDALQTAGYTWSKLDFDGRDAHLAGSATTEQEQQATLDTVRGTWGVRVINDETSLIQALKPYTWSIARDGRNVTTDGFAANDLDRKAVGDAAASQLRGLSMHQTLKLARGMPPRERWLAAVGFAAAQMADLVHGEAKLDDLGLSIGGVTATPQAYADIEKALHNSLPTGVTVVKDGLSPPDVKPYVWSADLQGQSLMLAGLVPGEQERKDIVAAARFMSPGNITVVDHMLIAGGQPGDWPKAATKAIGALVSLKSGTVRFTDSKADIRGVAVEQDTAEAAAKAFHSGMPAGFSAGENITFLNARVPVISPYVWSAQLSGKSLELSGSVPDEKTKSDLAAFANQRFTGARVSDRTSVGRGAPPGFEQAAMASLEQLARLDQGEAKLTGTALELSGHAPDSATADAAPGKLAMALPGGYEPSVNISADRSKVVTQTPAKPVEPAKPVQPAAPVVVAKPVETVKPSAGPYAWDAVLDHGVLTVSGGAPSAADRELVLNLIADRLPGVKVVESMKYVQSLPSSDSDWLTTIDAGLKAVADLGGGHVHIADRALTVTGSTTDKAMPDYVAESLHRAVPSVYSSSSQVDYAPPPAPPAYVTTLKYNGLRVALEGVVPDLVSKANLLARLKPLFPDRDFDDQTVVQLGAPAGWLDALLQGVGPLSSLDAGQLTLRDRQIYLSGTTEDQRVLDAARKKVSSGLPKGYGGADLLTYVAPPAPDPKLLAKRKDESKYDVGKLMRQPNLSAPECQAVLNSLLRGKAFFGPGRADLDGRAAASLNSVVNIATRCPATRVEISGHTDSDGASAFNQRLSERRAQAVVKFLAAKGIATTRLTAVGYGETEPVAPNDSPANKAQNRRIEFVVAPG